jgi:hypothetical protein
LPNSHKGPNIAGIDPESETLQPLFNPRLQRWEEHFEGDGALLRGKTPIGRKTIAVLEINAPRRVRQRRFLMEAGSF